MNTAYFSILDAFLKPTDGGVVKTDKNSHFIPLVMHDKRRLTNALESQGRRTCDGL